VREKVFGALGFILLVLKDLMMDTPTSAINRAFKTHSAPSLVPTLNRFKAFKQKIRKKFHLQEKKSISE